MTILKFDLFVASWWLGCLLVPVAGCHHDTVGPLPGGLRQDWFQPENGYGQARPAVLGTTVFFTTGDGNLVARRVSDGSIVWKTRIAAEQIGGYNVIAKGGIVVVPVSLHTVGVDATTGVERWRYMAPDDTDGSTVWRAAFSTGTLVDMLVTGRNLYASSGAALSVYDVKTGKLVARADAPTRSATPQVFGSAGIASGGHVFITVSEGAWSFTEP